MSVDGCKRPAKQVERNGFHEQFPPRGYQQPKLLGDDVLDLLDPSWEEFDLSSSAEMLVTIPNCLEGLSLNSRMLIKYRFEKGLTGRQIADKLGREVNAVYVAMTRA